MTPRMIEGKGTYVIRITGLECRESRVAPRAPARPRNFVVVDFVILESDNAEHPEGASRRWLYREGSGDGPREAMTLAVGERLILTTRVVTTRSGSKCTLHDLARAA